MNTARRQPIEHDVFPPLPAGSGDSLVSFRETAGLTWPKLAGSIGITEREVFQWRADNRLRSGPVHRAIVALARDLRGDGDHDSEGG